MLYAHILIVIALALTAIITGMALERNDRIIAISGLILTLLVGIGIVWALEITVTEVVPAQQSVFTIQEENATSVKSTTIWRDDNEIRIILVTPEDL